MIATDTPKPRAGFVGRIKVHRGDGPAAPFVRVRAMMVTRFRERNSWSKWASSNASHDALLPPTLPRCHPSP
jgi:hypothetical protein